MKSHVFGFALLSIIAIVASAPAQAQSGTLTRTFVSSSGSDTNPCTVVQPCATFARAYTQVQANGIIAALDPGKYGPLTNITTGLTVNGNGWAAVTAPANGDGFVINAGSGKVTLVGLEIDGAGTANNGIHFNSGSDLTVANCMLQNFTNAGILVVPDAAMSLLVANTIVANNATAGIDIEPGVINGFVFVSIDHVTANNNLTGIVMTNSAGQVGVNGTITNSLINSNTNAGVSLTSISSATLEIDINDSTLSNQYYPNSKGLFASGNTTLVNLSRDLISSNYIGVSMTNSADVTSSGNNDLSHNGYATGGGSLGSSPQQ
jgi:hypothetical protein